jgi:hypothetical protein
MIVSLTCFGTDHILSGTSPNLILAFVRDETEVLNSSEKGSSFKKT